MKPIFILSLSGLMILSAACAPAGDSEKTPPVAAIAEHAAPTVENGLDAGPETPLPVIEDNQPAATPKKATEDPLSTAPPPATATNSPGPTAPAVTPLEVTYFTPGQGEGPYYPLEKLDDRDNDLTVLEGAPGVPAGEIIEFAGKIYDAAGMPVAGAVIEIWQTDANGIYLHPGDPGTDRRDRNFQFYGESPTAADGGYSFRTILPGHYEPRPRHIHVKVKLAGSELLTTQFYFEGDPDLAGEAMFNQAGGDGLQLIIGLAAGEDAQGNLILVGERDIILAGVLPG